jgi:hypothetical protein
MKEFGSTFFKRFGSTFLKRFGSTFLKGGLDTLHTHGVEQSVD